MKALLHIFSALLLVALAAGCRPSEAERALRSAEALMETRPDSALTLLEAIDGSRLSGEPRARHALLLSQAYDKNYIDLTDDSLISIAVNFYDNSSDDRCRMLALHYKGTVNRNAGFYESALASALEAHDIALALNDTLNLCRIESLMANLYDWSENVGEAIKWESSALNFAKTLDKKRWILNGYTNNAEHYVALAQGEKALRYVDSALMIDDRKDEYIQNLLYRIYNVKQDYAKSDSVYKQMLTDGNNPSMRIVALQMANPLDRKILTNDISRYERFENCENHDDSIACYFIISKAAAAAGSMGKALNGLYGVIGQHNALLLEMMSHSLLKVQADYESSKALKTERKLQEKKKIMWYIGIIGVLLVCLMIFAVRLISVRNHNKRLALEMNLRALADERTQIKAELDKNREELASNRQELALNMEDLIASRNELAASRRECSALHADAAKYTRNLNVLRQKIAIAFLMEFSWVEKMGNIYLDAGLSTSSKEKKLYKAVAETVSPISMKKLTDKMIAELSRHDGGIMDEIDSLGLAPSEKQVLLYFLAGFSHRVICMLTGKSDNATYNIKKRLKHKLQNSKSALTDELLAHL